MSELQKLSRKYKIPIIEDAAHAMGQSIMENQLAALVILQLLVFKQSNILLLVMVECLQ